MENKKHRVAYDMNSKITDYNDEHHPFRVMARRIIEEVVEIQLGTFLTSSGSKRMENDITALLTNLE